MTVLTSLYAHDGEHVLYVTFNRETPRECSDFELLGFLREEYTKDTPANRKKAVRKHVKKIRDSLGTLYPSKDEIPPVIGNALDELLDKALNEHHTRGIKVPDRTDKGWEGVSVVFPTSVIAMFEARLTTEHHESPTHSPQTSTAVTP